MRLQVLIDLGSGEGNMKAYMKYLAVAIDCVE